MAAHQAQVKWEEVYPFAFYSASSQEWLYRICQQYAVGVNWVSETVNFGEQPKSYLERHQNRKTNQVAVKQKHVSKNAC